MKNQKKNTIARKVTRQACLVLLGAVIVLLIGAFHMDKRIVRNANRDYADAVVGVYTDLLREECGRTGTPVDREHTGEALRIGSHICERFDIDYVYLYTIDEEAGSVTYIAVAFSENAQKEDPGDHLTGHTVQCTLLEEELAVWHGEVPSVRIDLDNGYGHEITTLALFEDGFGNRMIAGVDNSFRSEMALIIGEFLLLAFGVIAVLLGVGFLLYHLLTKRVSGPAKRLSVSMQNYVADGKHKDVKLELEKGSPYEYAMIADAFNSMTDNIDSYVERIRTLTAEQSNRQTELTIAAGIQRGFLPKESMEDGRCSIRAMMSPAKDVGGDLYDCIELGNGRYLVVIADVSGKGVSAAMVMSVTLMLIRQYARMGLMPHEILEKTNDTLSENNAQLLFVTAFVGIYDSRAMTFTYSNAGHNLPYVLGRKLRVLSGAAGTLLGLYPGETYASETVTLQGGDVVFLYTDGITEAVDTQRRFFGEERLEEALKRYRASREEDPVGYVYRAVRAFAGEAEQFDDITMLSLTVKRRIHLELPYEIGGFDPVREEILGLPLSRSRQLDLCLAAEEAFANVCSYAFDGEAPEGERIGFDAEVGSRIELTFTDGGKPFDPLREEILPPDGEGEERAGGLGRLLYTSYTDDAAYAYRDGKNRLKLTKYFGEDEEE